MSVDFWLYISSIKNFDIVFKNNIIGFDDSYKKSLQDIKIGDILLIYISKRPHLDDEKLIEKYRIKRHHVCYAFSVASDLYHDTEPLWKHEYKVYPYRFKVAKTDKVNFKDPVPLRDFFGKISITPYEDSKSSYSCLQGKNIKKLLKEDILEINKHPLINIDISF